jgi:hypothetical protein
MSNNNNKISIPSNFPPSMVTNLSIAKIEREVFLNYDVDLQDMIAKDDIHHLLIQTVTPQ